MATLASRWDRIFDFYDQNDDGVISAADIDLTFDRMFTVQGIDPDSPVADTIRQGTGPIVDALLQADADGDGRVTREEWHRFYATELDPHETGTLMPSAGLLSFAQLGFQAFDLDGDGAITFGDYAGCARIFGIEQPQPRLEERFRMVVQRYGDGATLTWPQWLAGFIEIWCSPSDTVPFWYP